VEATPIENTIEPVIRMARLEVVSIWVTMAKPMAATQRPAARTVAGRTRLVRAGESIDPAMLPPAAGSSHMPASSGDRSSTSWRYWARNR
jgi:hypothetical protein